MVNDTIVAIATPPGRGGVGIVRISGDRLAGWLPALVDRAVRPRQATHCRFLADDRAIIDEGLLLFFPGPGSFTGEDVIELQGHGSPVVLDLLVRRAVELGARVARPGEFSERAFLNGKLDLVQAEAVADLVAADSETAARAAQASLQGEFSRRIREVVEGLVAVRVLVEAGLDFSEEDIELASPEQLAMRLEDLEGRLTGLMGAARQGSVIREGLRVAIVGKPNAGKSSLLNALSGVDSAIVSALPGTTRDVVRDTVTLGGVAFQLFDTAGLRDTDDPVEREGVRRAHSEMDRADLVLLVVDSQVAEVRDAQALVPEEFAAYARAGRLTVVCNKIDLSLLTAGIAGSDPPVVAVSAVTGAGLEVLRNRLVEAAQVRGGTEGAFMARRRHLAALDKALGHLQQARRNLATLLPELLAEELRQAQHALGSITGEFTSEDLLGEIFSGFCIGK